MARIGRIFADLFPSRVLSAPIRKIRVIRVLFLNLARLSIALLIFLLYAFSPSLSERISPYKDFSDDGAYFYGHGRELDEPENLEAVCIGVVGPGKTPEGEQLRNGVALAVEEANARGGYHGIPYRIVFRPDDGPWGVAAKQVVHLAYEDKAWVVLGALEGRQAHLAELVSAKAWIPILTPCAADLSIDYANVPWVFRFMPDDGRQARALLRYARTRGYKRLAVLTAGERESRTGFLRLENASKRERYPIATHIEYNPHNAMAVLPRLRDIDVDAVLIWGDSKSVLSLLGELRRENIHVPILLPASLAIPEIAQKGKDLGNVIVAAPFDVSKLEEDARPKTQDRDTSKSLKSLKSLNVECGTTSTTSGLESRVLSLESCPNDLPILTFRLKYQERTKTLPSPIALLAYDASRMAIAAIERAGLNRVRIRDELARMSFEGITGQIHFDSLGGNLGEITLCTIQNGQWIRLQD